jgi:predicted metal-dependent phosphoesterase TrpH
MRNEEIIKKLQNKGMDISMQDVYNLFPQLHNKIFNRSHIALTMVKKGYVKTYKEAFHNYIKEHGCCYVAGEKISVEEAIGVIHVAKGKAVLAHPHLLQKKQILTKLLEMNFDGIEIYYSHYKKLKIPKTQKKLIYTGGSDYHGTIRPLAHIGCSLTPKDQFEALLA